MIPSLLLVLVTAVVLIGAQQPNSLRTHPAQTDDDVDHKLREAPLPDDSVASFPAAAPGDSYSPFGIDQTVFDLVLSKLKERHDAMTALGNDTAKSVSYTHLTLPTILRV